MINKKVMFLQFAAIVSVSSAAVCITDDCFLCIPAGEESRIGKSWCKGVEYDYLQTTLGDCYVGSSREAIYPWESGRTGITDNDPACSVSVSITHVVLNEDNDCVREEAVIAPGADILSKSCRKFIPNPNSPACTPPSGS